MVDSMDSSSAAPDHFDRLPRHVAIIMDGNGRWAQERGELRMFGHRAGSQTIRVVLEECARLGIEALTLYSFSLENWKRPAEEVEALMSLALHHLIDERANLVKSNVRFRQVGRRAGLPEAVLREIDATAAATADCDGITLSLAMNYGSRAEIVEATRELAQKVAAGELSASAIDEAMISDHLWTRGLPDPDLLIRTAGEMRLSNFLLWQISYAELFVTETLWPDFGVSDLHAALSAYNGRDRRYGGLTQHSSS